MPGFPTNTTKQMQAAAILTRLEGGRIDRMRLLKLLYMADRESLKERGVPIVGGRVVAMKNGPLHSEIYDLIKESHEKAADWRQYFKSEGHVVCLIGDPGILYLSPYEVDKLTAISNRYRAFDTWSVADKTHKFPEWKKSRAQGSCTTITLETLLEAIGFSKEDVGHICADAEAQRKLCSEIQAC